MARQETTGAARGTTTGITQLDGTALKDTAQRMTEQDMAATQETTMAAAIGMATGGTRLRTTETQGITETQTKGTMLGTITQGFIEPGDTADRITLGVARLGTTLGTAT